jgi:hypothetical protein
MSLQQSLESGGIRSSLTGFETERKDLETTVSSQGFDFRVRWTDKPHVHA